MATLTGRVRRRLLAPGEGDVEFAALGFPGATSCRATELERIPKAVVRGFQAGVDGSGITDLARAVAAEPTSLRGFAVEGVVMAGCVVDALDPRPRDRARSIMLGFGHRHRLLAWIGVGFAMARLPRVVWPRAVPNFSAVAGAAQLATLSWLAVDGYAFDLAYHDHRRWLDGRRQPDPFPWQGRLDYVPRAFDQGFGRALWFVHGARPHAVAAAVNTFAEHRRADLWAGVGLAATLAGTVDRSELASLSGHADGHERELGLGAVFAATAADQSGFVPAHTHAAVTELTALTVEQAVALGVDTAPDRTPEPGGGEPGYEIWRTRIRAALDPPVPRPAGTAPARDRTQQDGGPPAAHQDQT